MIMNSSSEKDNFFTKILLRRAEKIELALIIFVFSSSHLITNFLPDNRSNEVHTVTQPLLTSHHVTTSQTEAMNEK